MDYFSDFKSNTEQSQIGGNLKESPPSNKIPPVNQSIIGQAILYRSLDRQQQKSTKKMKKRAQRGVGSVQPFPQQQSEVEQLSDATSIKLPEPVAKKGVSRNGRAGTYTKLSDGNHRLNFKTRPARGEGLKNYNALGMTQLRQSQTICQRLSFEPEVLLNGSSLTSFAKLQSIQRPQPSVEEHGPGRFPCKRKARSRNAANRQSLSQNTVKMPKNFESQPQALNDTAISMKGGLAMKLRQSLERRPTVQGPYEQPLDQGELSQAEMQRIDQIINLNKQPIARGAPGNIGLTDNPSSAGNQSSSMLTIGLPSVISGGGPRPAHLQINGLMAAPNQSNNSHINLNMNFNLGGGVGGAGGVAAAPLVSNLQDYGSRNYRTQQQNSSQPMKTDQHATPMPPSDLISESHNCTTGGGVQPTRKLNRSQQRARAHQRTMLKNTNSQEVLPKADEAYLGGVVPLKQIQTRLRNLKSNTQNQASEKSLMDALHQNNETPGGVSSSFNYHTEPGTAEGIPPSNALDPGLVLLKKPIGLMSSGLAPTQQSQAHLPQASQSKAEILAKAYSGQQRRIIPQKNQARSKQPGALSQNIQHLLSLKNFISQKNRNTSSDQAAGGPRPQSKIPMRKVKEPVVKPDENAKHITIENQESGGGQSQKPSSSKVKEKRLSIEIMDQSLELQKPLQADIGPVLKKATQIPEKIRESRETLNIQEKRQDDQVFVQGHNVSIGSFRSSSHQPSETSMLQGSAPRGLDFDKQIIRDSNLQLVLSHKRSSVKRHRHLSPYAAAGEQSPEHSLSREVTPVIPRKQINEAPYQNLSTPEVAEHKAMPMRTETTGRKDQATAPTQMQTRISMPTQQTDTKPSQFEQDFTFDNKRSLEEPPLLDHRPHEGRQEEDDGKPIILNTVSPAKPEPTLYIDNSEIVKALSKVSVVEVHKTKDGGSGILIPSSILSNSLLKNKFSGDLNALNSIVIRHDTSNRKSSAGGSIHPSSWDDQQPHSEMKVRQAQNSYIFVNPASSVKDMRESSQGSMVGQPNLSPVSRPQNSVLYSQFQKALNDQEVASRVNKEFGITQTVELKASDREHSSIYNLQGDQQQFRASAGGSQPTSFFPSQKAAKADRKTFPGRSVDQLQTLDATDFSKEVIYDGKGRGLKRENSDEPRHLLNFNSEPYQQHGVREKQPRDIYAFARKSQENLNFGSGHPGHLSRDVMGGNSNEEEFYDSGPLQVQDLQPKSRRVEQEILESQRLISSQYESSVQYIDGEPSLPTHGRLDCEGTEIELDGDASSELRGQLQREYLMQQQPGGTYGNETSQSFVMFDQREPREEGSSQLQHTQHLAQYWPEKMADSHPADLKYSSNQVIDSAVDSDPSLKRVKSRVTLSSQNMTHISRTLTPAFKEQLISQRKENPNVTNPQLVLDCISSCQQMPTEHQYYVSESNPGMTGARGSQQMEFGRNSHSSIQGNSVFDKTLRAKEHFRSFDTHAYNEPDLPLPGSVTLPDDPNATIVSKQRVRQETLPSMDRRSLPYPQMNEATPSSPSKRQYELVQQQQARQPHRPHLPAEANKQRKRQRKLLFTMGEPENSMMLEKMEQPKPSSTFLHRLPNERGRNGHLGSSVTENFGIRHFSRWDGKWKNDQAARLKEPEGQFEDEPQLVTGQSDRRPPELMKQFRTLDARKRESRLGKSQDVFSRNRASMRTAEAREMVMYDNLLVEKSPVHQESIGRHSRCQFQSRNSSECRSLQIVQTGEGVYRLQRGKHRYAKGEGTKLKRLTMSEGPSHNLDFGRTEDQSQLSHTGEPQRRSMASWCCLQPKSRGRSVESNGAVRAGDSENGSTCSVF